MSNAVWLVIALAVVAAAIGSYVWTLSSRRRQLTSRLRELRPDQERG